MDGSSGEPRRPVGINPSYESCRAHRYMTAAPAGTVPPGDYADLAFRGDRLYEGSVHISRGRGVKPSAGPELPRPHTSSAGDLVSPPAMGA
jgi:hypothetical protein